MRRFKNILVGVDLSQADRFVSSELPPPSVEAVERALWLAKRNSARLTLFYALDVPAAAERLMVESDGGKETVLDEAQDVLKELAARATAEGVTAGIELRFGKSWLELIRQVLRNEHDLVVAGTRHQSAWQGFLMGSTGMKLLRKCPCPVWITRPQERQKIGSVLVANDLSPISDLALELGVSIADLQEAQLHVLHVLELGLGRREWDSYKIRERARAEATKRLDDQLVRVGAANLAKPPRVDIVVDAADTAIMQRIEQCEIDLLVMGTVARGGIAGVLMGNTAERLLPRISCSVLAVKPDDFISPVGIQ